MLGVTYTKARGRSSMMTRRISPYTPLPGAIQIRWMSASASPASTNLSRPALSPRPRLERGTGQFAIRWLVPGHADAVRDEVRNGLARVLPRRLGDENCGTEDEGAHYHGEASGSMAYHQRTPSVPR